MLNKTLHPAFFAALSVLVFVGACAAADQSVENNAVFANTASGDSGVAEDSYVSDAPAANNNPPACAAPGTRPRVFPRLARPYGRSYPEWSAERIQWDFSFPPFDGTGKAISPLLDPNGDSCMYGQNGPVWYLESVLGGGTWTRDCTIPCDKALFFPTEACVADTVGFGPPLSVEQLRALCKRQVDKVNINNYVVTIDGQRLAGLDKLRFVTDVFAVTVPEDNIYDYMGVPWPAGVVFPVIADGYYVMLAPLPPGDHTLRVVYPGSLDMTYNLHIVALTLP